MSRPILTIIIPVFRVRQYLGACLDSVLSGSQAAVEVLVVDDCGNDGSLEVAEGYLLGHPNLKILRNPQNQGLSASRNRGIEAAKGRYLLFLDSDDTLVPGAVDGLVARLDRAELIDVLKIGYQMVWEDRTYSVSAKSIGFSHVSGRKAFSVLLDTGVFEAMATLYVVRTEFLRASGICFVPGMILEDNLFVVQLLWAANSVEGIVDPWYSYLQRPGSLSKTRNTAHLRSIVGIYAKLLELPASDGTDAALLRRWLDFQVEFNLKGGVAKCGGHRPQDVLDLAFRGPSEGADLRTHGPRVRCPLVGSLLASGRVSSAESLQEACEVSMITPPSGLLSVQRIQNFVGRKPDRAGSTSSSGEQETEADA